MVLYSRGPLCTMKPDSVQKSFQTQKWPFLPVFDVFSPLELKKIQGQLSLGNTMYNEARFGAEVISDPKMAFFTGFWRFFALRAEKNSRSIEPRKHYVQWSQIRCRSHSRPKSGLFYIHTNRRLLVVTFMASKNLYCVKETPSEIFPQIELFVLPQRSSVPSEIKPCFRIHIYRTHRWKSSSSWLVEK